MTGSAWNMLRPQLSYRRESFSRGLQAAGYKVIYRIAKPEPSDVLLIWNRYGGFDDQARHFERAGARVLVAENAYLDLPGKWFAVSLSHHNGPGQWPDGGPERWDLWGIELQPWRDVDEDVGPLILAQRGIGEPGLASPVGWAEATRKKIGGRIRAHPGNGTPRVPLEQDLARASAVVTWGSSAALRALIYGVPVWYAMPGWIGAGAAKPLSEWGSEPRRDDAARLAMFRRLAWAIASIDEVQSGEAFTRLLEPVAA